MTKQEATFIALQLLKENTSVKRELIIVVKRGFQSANTKIDRAEYLYAGQA